MVKISYYKWEITSKSVKAYGGKVKQYRHSFPVSDFVQIVKKILDICKKEGVVSKLDVLNGMHNAQLSSDRIFNKISHKYKVKIVFDILLSKEFIRQEGIKKYYPDKRGRIPYGYTLNAPKDYIEKWLNKVREK